MTDITELAQSHELRNKVNHRLYGALEFQGTSGENATITLSIDECKSIIAALDERRALVEALEKTLAIIAAAEKLVRCKGRYHSEQNYRALAVLFGVKTPDLPPLEHENAHYADAAEMEIAALRQRIAELENYAEAEAVGADKVAENAVHWMKRCKELESRTVKLPKPHAHLIWIQAGHAPDDFWDDVAVSHSEKDRCCDGSERYPVYARWEIEEMLADAGIKVEADSLDADVSNRNQPGMVVAVHIDVGDFVKFRGQVYEVKETDFDDHDVTLWFVCGEVLKCAAGCPIEVVSAPVEDE